ncbi:MAG: glutathione S-transferase family protein [Pseudomonadales bacterium]|nr:glutathione S-transferase family protein [Pseudomonadales bacterium]MDP7360406.1 glutathione S-transferase family protein [Pseudomonadales bacterium]MDP7595220.1 glutathione S-transferase family protein [Pseudomonadales bacterium]HJN53122.1 glutathione S-transferase family protein [Pseudomonadales bacterium]
MKLYARRSSSNSQKVLWFLGELELEYEFIDTGGAAGGLDAPEYLAMNPNGTVPLILDDDLPVWESHSILRYLAATYGAKKYWPQDPVARSRMDRWMDWSQAQFDAAFMGLFWGYYRTPQERRNAAENQRRVSQCQRLTHILDGQLSEFDYVAGNELTLADIPAGALMYRYVHLDVTGDLPENVAAWYERLSERVAFQDHIMRPFDELKGRLAY